MNARGCTEQRDDDDVQRLVEVLSSDLRNVSVIVDEIRRLDPLRARRVVDLAIEALLRAGGDVGRAVA